MVRRLEPMPSILAPSLAKKLARSTTWGSQAALSIVVVMGWTAAKMRAFSVAVTEASSRKISTDLIGLEEYFPVIILSLISSWQP